MVFKTRDILYCRLVTYGHQLSALMGVLFSRSSPESQPLIIPSTDTLPEPTSRFQKGIDVLAALKANKLPSQEQLNSFLRLVLHADVLDVDGVAGHGPVSDDVKKVVFDVRESVEAVLQIGMEKNGKWILYIRYRCWVDICSRR